jgi:hypothetical protein
MAIVFTNLNIDTLSDKEKEIEFLVSEHINGSLYPTKFIELMVELARLNILSVEDDATYYKLINKIRNEFISDVNGLIDRDQAIKLYEGNPKLIKLFEDLRNILIDQVPIMLEIDRKYKENQIVNTLQSFEMAQNDSELLGKLISGNVDEVDPNKEILDSTRDCIIACDNIIAIATDVKDDFEEFNFKVSKSIQGIREEILGLSLTLRDLNLPFEYAYKLSQVLNLMESNIPPTELDPFKNDVYEILITLLRKPKKFYSMLKKDEIIDGSISTNIFQVYPKIFEQSVIPLLESIENKDYQKQITFKNQCDLIDDNRELVTSCHNHLLGDNNNGN